MKLTELWSHYQRYTNDFNANGRTLAFGAGGLCWMFRSEPLSFPPAILWALIFVAGFLLSDVLYTLSGAISHRIFIYREEARQWRKYERIDGDVQKPRWVDRPAFFFFCTKAALLVAAFIAIAVEFAYRLAPR